MASLLALAGVASCGSAAPSPQATPTAVATTAPAPTQAAAPADGARPTSVIDSPPTTALFAGSISVLPADLRARMTGRSWHPGCPVGLDDLRLVVVPYRDPGGVPRRGPLVVRADVAAAVLQVFVQLDAAHFPIERMQLIDDFGADDDASMAANNTSAFNCRVVSGTSTWSQHAYGTAIDINTRWNPWIHNGRIDPPNGAAYVDRTLQQPGMIHDGDVVVRAFAAIGWEWGGNAQTVKDYQHFSTNEK
jgi:hypothetical protein